MYMWTKFEEGRSRSYGVIDWKQKGYHPTDRQTDQKTDICRAKCPLIFEGGGEG